MITHLSQTLSKMSFQFVDIKISNHFTGFHLVYSSHTSDLHEITEYHEMISDSILFVNFTELIHDSNAGK